MQCYLLCQDAFSPENLQILHFLGVSGFGLINFDSPKKLFPMMFNMFVNIFWRAAEGFSYMLVPFKFWCFNNLCSVFSLE